MYRVLGILAFLLVLPVVLVALRHYRRARMARKYPALIALGELMPDRTRDTEPKLDETKAMESIDDVFEQEYSIFKGMNKCSFPPCEEHGTEVVTNAEGEKFLLCPEHFVILRFLRAVHKTPDF